MPDAIRAGAADKPLSGRCVHLGASLAFSGLQAPPSSALPVVQSVGELGCFFACLVNWSLEVSPDSRCERSLWQ